MHHMHPTLPELPPVTREHLMAAYILIRPIGIPFETVLTEPAYEWLLRVVTCKAHQIRTEQWLATQTRRVQCVPRVRLGVDGHPIGYVTQLVPGRLEPRTQDELPLS